MACTIDFAAAHAAARGDAAAAARLLGAPEAVWASTGDTRPPDVALLVDETARLAAGQDEATEAGRALPPSEAVAATRLALE